MESAGIIEALRRIAQTLSGSLELDLVFDRVAEVARSVIPCDDVLIIRLRGDGTVQVHAYLSRCERVLYAGSLTDCSPSLRRALGGILKSDAAMDMLNPDYGADRWARDQGYQSGVAVPLARESEVLGNLGVASRTGVPFTENHVSALATFADLVVLAIEHERLWNLDAAQRRRMDAIDSLLLTMADSIDIREIFDRVSEVVSPVLSHDRMVLIAPTADSQRVRVEAVSGEPIPDVPDTLPVQEHLLNPELEFEIYVDLDSLAPDDSETIRLARKLGIRSALRIPLRMDTGGLGALVFVSRTPNLYQLEDVLIARRVADHMSLALSHQHLAEEAHRLAEERRRAEVLEERVAALRTELDAVSGSPRMIGESRSWKEALTQAAKVAPTETTVLLTGESGTGKDVVARFIHHGSPRAGGPFVAVNCAAIPEALLESELFGHEKGAFTGAISSRPGRIQSAAGGVLFLDEVGEMSMGVQAMRVRLQMGWRGPR
jgi:transcriptional regulator with GAF, ATPase, and Fis domain